MALNKQQVTLKRLFDLVVSCIGLLILFVPIFLLVLSASLASGQWGIFSQHRIGLHGKRFTIYKIRSLTRSNMEPVNWFQRVLRESKLDELPQLFNVLTGTMSLVGPRPDLPGYADVLKGEDRIILSVRPGITGPATLRYRDEDKLLATKKDPKAYNDEVIWPDKVRINKEYIQNWSFNNDLRYMIRTFFD